MSKLTIKRETSSRYPWRWWWSIDSPDLTGGTWTVSGAKRQAKRHLKKYNRMHSIKPIIIDLLGGKDA